MSQSEVALLVLVLVVFASGNVLATAKTLACYQINNQSSQNHCTLKL